METSFPSAWGEKSQSVNDSHDEQSSLTCIYVKYFGYIKVILHCLKYIAYRRTLDFHPRNFLLDWQKPEHSWLPGSGIWITYHSKMAWTVNTAPLQLNSKLKIYHGKWSVYLPPSSGSAPPWLLKSSPYMLIPSRILCLHWVWGASCSTHSLTQGSGELGPGLKHSPFKTPC